MPGVYLPSSKAPPLHPHSQLPGTQADAMGSPSRFYTVLLEPWVSNLLSGQFLSRCGLL